MLKKIMSNGKILIASVILLATVSAPVVVPVVCPQYAYMVTSIEKVLEFVGVGGNG
jgi:hypothetical protein